jgi:hypothetical protein
MKTSLFTARTSILKVALILLLALSLTNCSKDDDPAAIEEQNPFTGYLTATGFNEKTTELIDEPAFGERGFSFIPLATGKITAIVVKMPTAHPEMRVTIWDKAAGTVIRSEIINITTAKTEITKVIAPLDLIKDKEYFFTFNNNDRYRRERTDGSSTTYPITVGDIKITGFSWINGTEQVMPGNSVLNYISGDCSFKFQKTE